MFRYLYPTSSSCMPSRLGTAAILGMARSKIGPAPHISVPVIPLTVAEWLVSTGSGPGFSDTFSTRKRKVHTSTNINPDADSDTNAKADTDPDTGLSPEDTLGEDEILGIELPENWYKNKYKEDILFNEHDPPPGYAFVPSGNIFLTRYCRKHTQKVYAVYGNKRKGITRPIGLFVPEDIISKSEDEQEMKIEKAHAKVSRVLDKYWPQMPPDDRDSIYYDFTEGREGLVTALTREEMNTQIALYVWKRHSPFRRYCNTPELSSPLGKAYERSQDRVIQILVSWCGENPRLEFEKMTTRPYQYIRGRQFGIWLPIKIHILEN
ncbi:hypothetical protein F4810DRAFT_673419, partial [Camillea tinctor]